MVYGFHGYPRKKLYDTIQHGATGEFHHPGLGLGLGLRFRITVRVSVRVRVSSPWANNTRTSTQVGGNGE